MFSYNRLKLELAVIVHCLFGSKWKEEKLIVLVEKHKAVCKKMRLLFIQTNI